MASQVGILVYLCISLVVINEEEERGMRGLHVKHVNHTALTLLVATFLRSLHTQSVSQGFLFVFLSLCVKLTCGDNCSRHHL
jgi:hypothetical protein